MTELERIQLLLSKKFGCDVAMAVYMAVMCYRPTEDDSLEFGMRAMHAWKKLYEENGITQSCRDWGALDTDRKADSTDYNNDCCDNRCEDDCHGDY